MFLTSVVASGTRVANWLLKSSEFSSKLATGLAVEKYESEFRDVVASGTRVHTNWLLDSSVFSSELATGFAV